MKSLFRRLLREPLVHFLFLGAAMFALFNLTGGQKSDVGQIVVSAGQVENLVTTFARTWQRPPTQQELKGLIDDYIREEVLYREAVAMGLDRDDTIIRRRLSQKMDFLSDDFATQTEPTDAELRSYLQKHADSYREEPQVSFRQLYINADKRGESASNDARQLLLRVSTANSSDKNLESLGDSIMIPHEFNLTSKSEIARIFGEDFAQQLVQLKPGKWSGPVRSGYGLHLVFILEMHQGGLPEFTRVRDVVRRDLLDARRRETREKLYQSLLAHYSVKIEFPTADEMKKPK